MISQVKSFPYLDKQGTPEEDRRIQRLKRCALAKNNKDEDNSPKNNTKYYTSSITSKIPTDNRLINTELI